MKSSCGRIWGRLAGRSLRRRLRSWMPRAPLLQRILTGIRAGSRRGIRRRFPVLDDRLRLFLTWWADASARAWTWGEKRQFDKAIADYTETIRLNPRFARAYWHRGWAWNEKKEFDKGLADYAEARRIESNGH